MNRTQPCSLNGRAGELRGLLKVNEQKKQACPCALSTVGIQDGNRITAVHLA